MKTSFPRALGASFLALVFTAAACSSESDGAPLGRSASPAPDRSAPLSTDPTAADLTKPRLAVVPSTGLPINVMPVYKKHHVGVASNACSGTAPQLKYLGGPVIQNAKIVSVLWTAGVDPNVTSKIGGFYTDLLASSYYDILGEYSTGGVAATDGQPGTTQGISRGSYGGQYTITPSVCAGTATCSLTDAQIQTELAAQIAAGHLPAIETGCDGQTSSLYMFEFPANVTVSFTLAGTTSTSCVDFCGYHENATIGGKIVPYGVIPNLESGACASVCSESAAATFDDVTSVHSHEVAEAVTDTGVNITTAGYIRPSAWGDESCGEIGDICNFQESSTTLNGNTWTVQQLWSNVVNDCTIVGKPPSVCTGASTPAGCRACECSDANYGGPTKALGCTGTTPWCETSATNVKHGDCVQCTTASECAAKQVCEQSATAASDDVCAACGGAGEPCCAGSTCTAPQTCGGGGTANQCGCTGVTTCGTGKDCGTIANGCGGTVVCGAACAAPASCGGGGTANECGCTPLTACPAGDDCGTIANGCGGTVMCGAACTAPETCGGAGGANKCGCTALTACPAGENCGTISNGCGGTVACGAACTAPQTCGGGGTVNACGCTPLTACPGGQSCGSAGDGCGGQLSCGTCTAPQTCAGGGTANVCGCTPLTACPAGDTCGAVDDTCGGTVTCGACGANQTCANNQCIAGETSDDAGTGVDSGVPAGQGDAGTGTGPVASDDAGTGGNEGGSPAAGDGSASAAPGSSNGCSCRTVTSTPATGSGSSALAGIGALFLFGAARRRRRERAA